MKKSFPGRRLNCHLNSPSLKGTLKSRRMGSSGKSPVLFSIPLQPPFNPCRRTRSSDRREKLIGCLTDDSLFAVSEPFAGQIIRRKPTSDPMPPSGSGKDKILYTEAVGLVMIDYGDAVVGGFGKSMGGAIIVHERMERRVYMSGRGELGKEKEEDMGRKLITRG